MTEFNITQMQKEWYAELGYMQRTKKVYTNQGREGYVDITDISKPVILDSAPFLFLSIAKRPCPNPKYFYWVITEVATGMKIGTSGTNRKEAIAKTNQWADYMMRSGDDSELKALLAGQPVLTPAFVILINRATAAAVKAGKVSCLNPDNNNTIVSVTDVGLGVYAEQATKMPTAYLGSLCAAYNRVISESYGHVSRLTDSARAEVNSAQYMLAITQNEILRRGEVDSLRTNGMQYLEAIQGRLRADNAANTSDAELTRVLGPYVIGPYLVKVAKVLRDDGIALL